MLARSQQARDAVRRSHKRHAQIDLYHAGSYVGEVPIEDGSVSFSLTTANGNRSGSMEVPGYEWFEPLRPKTSASVRITISVDGERFALGSFPVMRAEVERPRGTVRVNLGDWAHRRAQPHAEETIALGRGMTVAQVCRDYMSHVLPGGAYTISRDDTGGAAAVPFDLRLGGNVWQGLQSICNFADAQLITTDRNTGMIRRYDPSAPVVEDLTGTVVREQLAEDVGGLVNRVMFLMEDSDPGAVPPSYPGDRRLTTGPYRYDQDLLGEMTYVEQESVPDISAAAAQAAADRIFKRRAGIVLAQSIDVVPQPWLQLGDHVRWTPSWVGTPADGLIETMTVPLTVDGVMRITLRDANVTAVAA